jgi:serine protease Do
MDNVLPPESRDPRASRGKFSGSPKGLMAAALLSMGALAFVSGGVVFSQANALGKSNLLQSTAAVAPLSNAAAPPSPRLLQDRPNFSFADLVERVSPAVVTIQVDVERKVQTSSFEDGIPEQFGDLFRQFGGRDPMGRNRDQTRPNRRGTPQQSFRSRAAGSGFIIDSEGYVVTNNHVVESARKIMVKLADKREFEAKLIGTDKDTDVALLKISGHNLPTVTLGDESHLRVGDWVVAVGNPFGLGGTVTAGIVSSMGRDIGNGPYTDFIQIDAPINQGNSGGPTFDIGGRVVGMNSAIYSPSGGSVGIGFAIPASTVKNVVDGLKSNGSISRGWLGVQIQDFTPELASGLGVKDAKGAMVAHVMDNSPASRAGFAQGDVVIALNGRNVDDSRGLTRQVAGLQVGEKASFTVLRDGAKRNLTATIEKRDADKLAADDKAPSSAEPSSLGLTLAPINPALRQQHDLGDNVSGVFVSAVDPNSEAASKGIKSGDVIKRVGNRQVRAPSDISRAVADAKQAGRATVLMLVASGEGEHFVALKVG